jgi:hypothetical protein
MMEFMGSRPIFNPTPLLIPMAQIQKIPFMLMNIGMKTLTLMYLL